MPVLPLFNHVFSGQKRFFLCHNSEYLCLLPRVQHHFVLHLAPKCTAFSTKTPCVLPQNATRLATKHHAFSTKTHFIQQQNAQNLVQIVALCKENTFSYIYNSPHFCIKTNLRENRLFEGRLTIGEEKGHILC